MSRKTAPLGHCGYPVSVVVECERVVVECDGVVVECDNIARVKNEPVFGARE